MVIYYLGVPISFGHWFIKKPQIFIDRELQGVIFVFNPDNDGHRDELDFYYDSFIRKSKLSDSNAIVFALNNSEANPSTKLSLCKCNNITYIRRQITSWNFFSQKLCKNPAIGGQFERK